ncbi:4336_t:CDS:1, partial [Cetraspora pellucida]
KDEECFKYRKEIIEICRNTPEFVVEENFSDDDKDPIDGPIDSDRDKDIPIKCEGFKFLVQCKLRGVNRIGYNDVERLSSVVKTYHENRLGAMVTNKGYPKNSTSVYVKLIILLQKSLKK